MHLARIELGLPVIAVSADEVIWALLHAGFEIRERREGVLVLASGWHVVEVPAMARLLPGDLFGILSQAGLSYSELLERLAEAPTQPGAVESSVRRKRPR